MNAAESMLADISWTEEILIPHSNERVKELKEFKEEHLIEFKHHQFGEKNDPEKI